MRVILVLVLALVAHASAQADLRVQVIHRNGESFVGIARAGVKIEVSKRGQFTKGDDEKAKGAGIRVWYWSDLDGYIFIEYTSVKSVSVLGSLTSEESVALAKAMVRVRIPVSRPAPSAETTEAPKPTSQPTEPAPNPEDAPILKEFPIDEGWNLERFGTIQRRRIVLHLNPTKKEREFVERFDEFREAFLKVEATKPQPPAPVTPP